MKIVLSQVLTTYNMFEGNSVVMGWRGCGILSTFVPNEMHFVQMTDNIIEMIDHRCGNFISLSERYFLQFQESTKIAIRRENSVRDQVPEQRR